MIQSTRIAPVRNHQPTQFKGQTPEPKNYTVTLNENVNIQEFTDQVNQWISEENKENFTVSPGFEIPGTGIRFVIIKASHLDTTDFKKQFRSQINHIEKTPTRGLID